MLRLRLVTLEHPVLGLSATRLMWEECSFGKVTLLAPIFGIVFYSMPQARVCGATRSHIVLARCLAGQLWKDKDAVRWC